MRNRAKNCKNAKNIKARSQPVMAKPDTATGIDDLCARLAYLEHGLSRSLSAKANHDLCKEMMTDTEVRNNAEGIRILKIEIELQKGKIRSYYNATPITGYHSHEHTSANAREKDKPIHKDQAESQAENATKKPEKMIMKRKAKDASIKACKLISSIAAKAFTAGFFFGAGVYHAIDLLA